MPIAPLASEKLQDSAALGRAAPARARRLLCHGLCNARVCPGSGMPGGLLGGRTRCALCRGFKARIVLLLACLEATLWYMPCSGVVIYHNLSPLRHEPSSAPWLKCLLSNLQSTYCKLAMAA
jgi:hypothetical protein